ncbi:unnamed protein product [Prunus brigantina]
MQVDSKPFPPPVINMVNAQLRVGRWEEHRPAKGKEPMTEPKPVLCSRRTTLRPLRTFKPPVVRDDRWYHIQHGGNVQPLTKTQLRRMQRQAQQAREQIPQAEGSQLQRELEVTQEPLPAPFVPAAKSASIRAPRVWRPRKVEDPRREGAEFTMNMVLVLPSEFSAQEARQAP